MNLIELLPGDYYNPEQIARVYVRDVSYADTTEYIVTVTLVKGLDKHLITFQDKTDALSFLHLMIKKITGEYFDVYTYDEYLRKATKKYD